MTDEEPPVGQPPAAAPPPTPDKPRRDVRTLVLICAAGLSVVISVGALLVAWRALDQANDARDLALVRGNGTATAQPTGTAPAPGGSGPTPVRTATGPAVDPGTSATDAPPPLTQQTAYRIKYEKQTLTLKPQGIDAMYADLDEPRANVGTTGHDIALHSGDARGPAYFALGSGVEGSESATAGMTPQDCGERIRTAPVGGSRIPARQGSVLCMTTSYGPARTRGDFQRLVLLEVTAVTNDSTVTVQVTAWDILR